MHHNAGLECPMRLNSVDWPSGSHPYSGRPKTVPNTFRLNDMGTPVIDIGAHVIDKGTHVIDMVTHVDDILETGRTGTRSPAI